MTSDEFTPDFTLAGAYPAIASSEAALRSRDWAAFRAVYDAAADWDERDLIMGSCSGEDGLEEFLRERMTQEPDDPIAPTMLGGHLVQVGWGIRTASRAKDVSREQWTAFYEHLHKAEALLAKVCAQRGDFVPAWSHRMTISRGISLGLSESRRRYDRLARHAPHDVSAQSSMLQQLCPKWSGDFATMHQFAADCTAAAPPGSFNAVLVVEGHLEHWLAVTGDERTAYFKQQAVRDEILAAGERSVLHPDFGQRVGWVRAFATFALGYTMLEDWTRAKRCFEALGRLGAASDWWGYFGDPTAAFVKYRARAMEQG